MTRDQRFLKRLERLASVSVQDPRTRPGVEPNPVYRNQLIGTSAEDAGVLLQFRMTDPTIAPAMDFIVSALQAVEFDVEPPDDPTPVEARATDYLRTMIRRGIRGGFAAFFARAGDWKFTFGRQTCEIIQQPARYSHLKWDVELTEIAPWSVNRFITDDSGFQLLQVEQVATMRRATIDAWKLVHITRQVTAGDFNGWARLRAAAAVCLWYEAVMKTGLSRSLVDVGVPITKDTVAEAPVKDRLDEVHDWAEAWVEGEIGPLHLPYGTDLDMFNPAAAGRDPLPLLKYLDELKRSVTATTLQSLGTSATGSRALGEQFAIADRARFTAWVNELLDDLNGEGGSGAGDLVGPILEIGGYPKHGLRRPRIIADGLGRADLRDHVSEAIDLIKRGMPVGADDWESLRDAVGMQPPPADAQPVVGETEPFEAAKPAQATMTKGAGVRRHAASCGCGACAPQTATFARQDGPRWMQSTAAELEAEQYVDFDGIERRIDRAVESLTQNLQALSEGHRREFFGRAEPLIRVGDVAAIASLSVDYVASYREEILDTMQRQDRWAREQLHEEFRRAGIRVPAEDAPVSLEGPTATDRERALATMKAIEVNDEVNEQLRQFAMAAVDTGDDAPILAYVLAAGVAAGIATNAVLTSISTARDEEARRTVAVGVQLAAVYTSRLDGATCDECALRHGTVVVVGSPEYYRLRPPNPACASAQAATGNRCRCYYIYVEA